MALWDESRRASRRSNQVFRQIVGSFPRDFRFNTLRYLPDAPPRWYHFDWMSESERDGSPADRTIVIEGPFQTAQERDDLWARATIEAEGRQYRVALLIPGPSDFHHFFGMPDEEREEARVWFALVDLAKRSTSGFGQATDGSPAEVTVRIPQAPPLRRWMIEDVLDYVHDQLREYVVERKGPTWQARPATIRPQVRQPRLPARPPVPGASRNADRDRKPARPMIITFDPEGDPQPPPKPGPKKGGKKTLLDSLTEVIKNVGRG